MEIYILKDRQQHGPLTLEEVKSGQSSGRYADRDLAWKEALPAWIPLQQLLAASRPPRPPNGGESASAWPSSLASNTPIGHQVIIPQRSGLAVASLVCGILGLFFGLPALPAIFLGHAALSVIRREGNTVV